MLNLVKKAMPKQGYCGIQLEARPEPMPLSVFLSISATGHGVLAVTLSHLTDSMFVTGLMQDGCSSWKKMRFQHLLSFYTGAKDFWTFLNFSWEGG